MTNPYLTGSFAPVHEELTATDLEVTGHIPEYLDGRYLRNGPNPVAEVDPAAYHWFTGDGMVHGVRLRNGAPSGTATAGCAARRRPAPSASIPPPAAAGSPR